ncbi:MAG: PH domain-containing protein [Solirubrobacterales bacterium]
MELHPGEEAVFKGHPSWRGVLAFYVKGTLGALAVAAVLYFVDSTTTAVLAFLVIFGVTVLVGFIMRMFTVYTITTERLSIRTGILSKHVQQASIDRVQNVNTSQGPIDRILQVGKVDFDTAGTDDSSFTFDGVADPDEIVAAIDHAKREHARDLREQGL